MKNNILIIGDLHLGRLGYSEYIKDGRSQEKKEIFDFIIKESSDCETIVFLGDQFNTKNPLSETIKEFISFLEKFGEKQIFIISGNHELKSNGETAIDYLKEILNKKWNIITNKAEKFGNFIFAPYLTKNLLECNDNKMAAKKITDSLSEGKILFTHYSLSGSKTSSGCSTDFFDEPVLSIKELKKKFKFIFSGHIHQYSQPDSNTIVSGSIFNNEIGEDGKYIFKIKQGSTTLELIEKIPLPGRKIYKLENPSTEDLKILDKNNIIKIILTEKKTPEEIELIKAEASKFDAFIFTENIPNERKKIHIDNNKAIVDFSIEELLELYSKEKNVDLEKLKAGFNLIRS